MHAEGLQSRGKWSRQKFITVTPPRNRIVSLMKYTMHLAILNFNTFLGYALDHARYPLSLGMLLLSPARNGKSACV